MNGDADRERAGIPATAARDLWAEVLDLDRHAASALLGMLARQELDAAPARLARYIDAAKAVTP